MKPCVCGQTVASNALVCPHCGNRFTHPLVTTLAWVLGIAVLICIVGMIVADFQSTGTTSRPVAPTQAVQPKPSTPPRDEPAFVIQHCGRPDREFKETAYGEVTIRHLVYHRFHAELFFFYDADTPWWRLGNAFVPDRDEQMSMEEANRRMPCAKGQLHSLLDPK